MTQCLVCHGSKRVRLPLYHQVLAALGESGPDMRETSREYACPECCGIPEERVKVIGCSASVSGEFARDPGYLAAIRHQIARQMADEPLKAGFIAVEVSATDNQFRAEATATLGVVSPFFVASMEQRIAEHQEVVAREVASAAAAGIRVWGSYYSGDDGNISKAQAVDAVAEAFKSVLQKRKA